MDIILASTSPYRRRLLERLGIPFRCCAPDTVETPLPRELPVELVERLSCAKAQSVANLYPNSVVVGSDQVAVMDNVPVSKPGSHENAVLQLRACAGKTITFFTGLALICPQRGLNRFHVEPFSVRFRQLSDTQIENYLRRERPYDCAGSFKVEGLGIALFSSLIGEDPTSLEGLPLIALTNLLQDAGVNVLGK